MKITITQTNLVKGLQHISKVIKTNTQMPILGSFVMDITKDHVQFWATDMNSLIRVEKPAAADGEGKIAIPLSQFQEYCQNLSSAEVTLTVDGDTIEVVQSKSRATFPMANVDDYPDVLKVVEKETFSIESTAFEEMLKKVLISVSPDESRPVLTGILFKVKDKTTLNVVGTDGYRLSLCDVPYSGELEREFVAPGKMIATLLKGNVQDTVSCGFDNENNQIWFKSGDLFIAVRTIGGDFPPYEKIIPSAKMVTIVVDKESLLQAVKQMAVFAKFNANILRWDVGSVLKMSTQASATGEGGAEVDVQFEGEELAVAFNYRYLQEYLNIINGDTVEIVFNGSLAPVMFREPKEDGFMHIIMPVKLQE